MPAKEYRGRLSTGCEKCRARRIKCDEGKPSCTKCTKAGLDCNYRDLFQIAFRNENPKAAERAQKTWRARVKAKPIMIIGEENEPCDRGNGGQCLTVARTPEPFSSAPLSIDIMDCAVNRFWYDYVVPDKTLSSRYGSYDYLPGYYAKAKPGSSLYEAIRMVALANFDRRTGRGLLGLRQDIDRQYGNTLRVVAEEAALPNAAESDGLLLAVQMLGIYEMMNTGGNNLNFLQAHSVGVAALYKSRAAPIIRNESDWLIFRGANLLQLSVCLRLGVPSFIPYSLVKDIYSDSSFQMSGLFSLLHQGIDLMALWRNSDASCDSSEKSDLLHRISALDLAFDAWEMNCPPLSQFTLQPTPDSSTLPRWLRPIVDHPGMPEKVHEYSSIQVVYIWSMVRMLRMQMSSVLMMASLLAPTCHATPQKHRRDIVRIAEDCCRCVLPVFTQAIPTKPDAECTSDVVGFRALMAITPLRVAKTAMQALPTDVSSESRGPWIESTLDFIYGEFHSTRPPLLALY